MTIEECAMRWGLEVEAPFEPLTWNAVMPATRDDGSPVVLKIGSPGAATEREAAALRLYSGRGAPVLYEADVAMGALLLERITPGTPLSAVEDDWHATSIAADVLRRLPRPLPEHHPFSTVAALAADLGKLRPMFDGGTGPIPERLVEMAESLFADLIASQGESVLLHGDLHHDNILRSERDGWLAIDPKGVAGEREYDTGALMRNPAELLRQLQPGRILARRIDQLAEELDMDRQRVLGWALAQSVLAAFWGLEDTGEPWAQGLACAELLSALK